MVCFVKRMGFAFIAVLAATTAGVAQLAEQVPDAEWRPFIEVRNDGSPYAKRLGALFLLGQGSAAPAASSFLVAKLGDFAAVMMRPRGGCAREARDGDFVAPLERPDLETCWTVIARTAPDGSFAKVGEVDACSRVDAAGRPALRGDGVAMAARFNGFVNTAVRKQGHQTLLCATSIEAR